MNKVEKELDEFGKKAITRLQPAPPLSPEVQAEERAKFLLLGENLRKNIVPGLDGVQSKRSRRKLVTDQGKFVFPVYKVLAVAVLLLVLVAGSSFTVYAAQSSLPGEPLYAIKSAGEDLRLAMTHSSQARLNLTLDYTARRLGEIQKLLSHGNAITDQASVRYQQQLEEVLQAAAQMDDQQLEIALGEIKIQAESQGMTLQELIASLPDQASPAILHLQERLNEQVQLSTIGEKNPQQFRKDILERAKNRRGPKKSATSDEPGETPILATGVPLGPETGNSGGKPSDMPAQGNPGNGQGQPGAGNGNHGSNPTHTPRP